jgi:hypothetical protein
MKKVLFISLFLVSSLTEAQFLQKRTSYAIDFFSLEVSKTNLVSIDKNEITKIKKSKSGSFKIWVLNAKMKKRISFISSNGVKYNKVFISKDPLTGYIRNYYTLWTDKGVFRFNVLENGNVFHVVWVESFLEKLDGSVRVTRYWLNKRDMFNFHRKQVFTDINIELYRQEAKSVYEYEIVILDGKVKIIENINSIIICECNSRSKYLSSISIYLLFYDIYECRNVGIN